MAVFRLARKCLNSRLVLKLFELRASNKARHKHYLKAFPFHMRETHFSNTFQMMIGSVSLNGGSNGKWIVIVSRFPNLSVFCQFTPPLKIVEIRISNRITEEVYYVSKSLIRQRQMHLKALAHIGSKIEKLIHFKF